MAYIGKSPTVGNFVKLDALTASATASYTMQLDSVNFSPESVNHMLVSLNGVIQAPTDSYTISGSTITFASALTASDSIDFIMVYGNVLDIGTPSDNTVSLAKLTATGTKDATTFLRGDNTFATAGVSGISSSSSSTALNIDSAGHVTHPLTSCFQAYLASDQSVSATSATVTMNTEAFDINSDFNTGTYTFTAPVTGKYLLTTGVSNFAAAGGSTDYVQVLIKTSNADYNDIHWENDSKIGAHQVAVVADMDASDTAYVQIASQDDSSYTVRGTRQNTFFSGYLLG